jgi:hypothetical protein
MFQNGIHIARFGSTNSVSNITISNVTIATASTRDSGVTVDAKGTNICFDTVTVNNAGQGVTDPTDETKANGFYVNVESSFGSLTGLQFIRTISTLNKRDGYAFSPHTGNGISHAQFYGAQATANLGDGFDLSGATPELYNVESINNGNSPSHQQGRGIIFWTDGYVENSIVASNQASGIVANESGGDLTVVSSTLSDNDRALAASSRQQLQNGAGALTIYDAVISGPGTSVVAGNGSVNCDYNLFGGTRSGQHDCYGANSQTHEPTLSSTYYLVSAGPGVATDGVDDGIDPRTPLGTQVKYAGTLDRNLGCRPKDGDGNGSFVRDVGALETGSGACQGTPPSPTRTITPTQPTRTVTSTSRPTRTPNDTATPTMTRTVTATPSISPTPLPTTTPCSVTCVGNCNDDCTVTIDELIKGVQIALGAAPLSQCPASDPSGDQVVAINELIAAVGNALQGCGHSMSLPRAVAPQSGGWWGLRDAGASDLRLVVLGHPKKSVRGDGLGSVWLSTGGNAVGALKFDLEYPQTIASLLCWPEQEVAFQTLELGNQRIRVVVGEKGFPATEIVEGPVLSCKATNGNGNGIGNGKKNLRIIRATAADVFGNPLPIAVGDAAGNEDP